MINDAVQSFLYGLFAIGIVAVIAGICRGVKSFCYKLLKRGKNYDDK